MAQDPKNYRDPKVTEPRQSSSSMSWVWIVAAVIVVLLLLAWMITWVSASANDPLATLNPWRNSPVPVRAAPSAMFDGTETDARRT